MVVGSNIGIKNHKKYDLNRLPWIGVAFGCLSDEALNRKTLCAFISQ